MLVSGMFMKLNYLCQMNVLLLKLWNCKMCISHFFLPSMFDQFVQKVLCILFWKIMNISFHNILHAVSSHSLFMIVIACQITGNLNVWMTAPSSSKTLLQQQKHQSTVLLAFCQKGIPLARDLWWKVLPCHKVFVYQDTIAFHWWPPSFSFKLLCILYSTTLITYDIILHQIWY